MQIGSPYSGSGLVDLHCHVLPGLDDGPTDLAGAAALAEGLAALSFVEIYPTPHQKAGAWSPSEETCNRAAEALRTLLAQRGATLAIRRPAGENMWDELFLSRLHDHSYPTYPGAKAFLIEFHPGGVPPMVDQRLFEFRMAGRLPVLAHVERYPDLVGDLGRVEALGRRCALLVNLSSLAGESGFWTRRATRRLVQNHLVHAVASDSHGADDLPYLEAGLRWIRETLGAQRLTELLVDNPHRILGGELPETH